jgi:hypothetical protein
MYGFYTPILIVQALCLYHAYRHRAEQRWFWFIILFSVIGCMIYVYHHFNSGSSIAAIKEGVKEAVNSNYRIEQLEAALALTDNVTNKVNLADEYLKIGKIDEAIKLYEESLAGFMADDPTLQMKLLQAFHAKGDYDAVIKLAQVLENDKTFRSSEERMLYAWALHKKGFKEESEKIFDSADRSFTNYAQRLEYCKYLKEINNQTLLKEKLQEILNEFEVMKGRERKMYKQVRHEVRDMYETLNADLK